MYPTVDPETGIELNETRTDIVLIWFVEDTKREWLRAVIKAALWQFKGQWRYDLTRGVPYFESIFVNAPDVLSIANIFRTELAKIPEVEIVLALTVNYDGAETLSVTWTVLCGGVPVEDTVTLVGQSGDTPYPFVFGPEFSSAFA